MANWRETGNPIGTYEELVEHNLDPAVYGSCSPPGPENKGCPAYKNCRFTHFRDRIGGWKGPENIGVIVISPNDSADGKIMSCYHYYASTLDALRRHADKNGYVVQIKADRPGGTILTQGSNRKHLQSDPSCPACQQRNCQIMERWEKEVEVPHFVRLSDMTGTQDKYALGYAERLRASLREEVETEKAREAFHRGEPKGEPMFKRDGRRKATE